MVRINWLRLAAVAVAILGAVILWRSTEMGSRAASTMVRDSSGWWTSQYDPEKKDAYALSFRLMGAVLLGVGAYQALAPARVSKD